MDENPQTDLFILHSDADTEWIEDWLMPRLAAQGLTVATDEDFRIGRTVALNYELAVAQSRYVAFVLTPEGLDDRWAAFAASLALHRDPANLTERLLPLLLRPCPELPAALRDRTPADFSDDANSEAALHRLIDVLVGNEPNRKRAKKFAPLITLSQAVHSIKRHPVMAAIASLIAVSVALFAIYADSGAQAKYPLFPTSTPLPTVTSAPTAEPTTTPTPTRTPLLTPTPLAFRPAAEGETLIVIAKFAYLEGADDTDPAGEIALSIQAAAKELDFKSLRVKVEPTQIGRLARPEAEALGRQYRAAIVIWGEVSTVAVTTNFLNLAEPNLPAADVSIRETERTQALSEYPVYAKYIVDSLPKQLIFLTFSAIGNAYYLKGDFISVKMAFEQAIASLPDDAKLGGQDIAYAALGFIYQSLGDLNAAITNYDKAIELNPIYAVAYFNRGIALSDLKNYTEAISSYDKAIELNPTLEAAFVNRGIALSGLEKYTEAIASYDKAIELNPTYTLAYNNRGNAFRALKQYTEAIVSYDKAIELNPVYTKAYFNRGIVLSDLKKYTEAIASYDKAIELNPTLANTHNHRGNALSALDKYTEAIASYDKAIELNPTYTEAYNNRGNAFKALKQYAKAIVSYDKVIELNPIYTEAYLNRGIALSGLEKYRES